MAKARTRPAPPRGPYAQGEEAIARGDNRRGRALLRQALAGGAAATAGKGAGTGADAGAGADGDGAAERKAAQALLDRTGVDPVALAVAGAVLLVIAVAAWLALLHRAG